MKQWWEYTSAYKAARQVSFTVSMAGIVYGLYLAAGGKDPAADAPTVLAISGLALVIAAFANFFEMIGEAKAKARAEGEAVQFRAEVAELRRRLDALANQPPEPAPAAE